MNQQGAHSLVPTRINDFQRCWRRVCERAAPEVTLAPNGKLMAKHCLRQCSSRYQHALVKTTRKQPRHHRIFRHKESGRLWPADFGEASLLLEAT